MPKTKCTKCILSLIIWLVVYSNNEYVSAFATPPTVMNFQPVSSLQFGGNRNIVQRIRRIYSPSTTSTRTSTTTVASQTITFQTSNLLVRQSASSLEDNDTAHEINRDNFYSDLDPLLSNVLFRASSALEVGDEGDRNSIADLGSITTISNGLKIWRSILNKGRLPIPEDFATTEVWPVEPLFSRLSGVMADIQLPRFVLRHPEMITSVLLSMVQLTIEFAKRQRLSYQDGELDEGDEDHDESLLDEESINQEDEVTSEEIHLLQSEIELELLADEIAKKLSNKFGDVIGGVNALDQLFGAGHGLLNVHEQQNQGSPNGFGLTDGVWQHTGWQAIPELQRQLASMSELRDLMKSIGRRPTAEDSDTMHKFAPRKNDVDGSLGAQYDPSMRTSVNGLTLSSSLSEMLPSEAVLLRGSSPALRRLFLAKKVESKLLSYELSGWVDTPSIPLSRPHYLPRMPSGPGGPLIICLDTSWSMSGMRETLSKAVVLACVAAAHKQHRDCQIVAFSTEHGVMETGEIGADSESIRRLLDFLSHSFGGGTDVTGALKHAIETLGSEAMSAADVLMVTDGEIPDPPVSNEVMEDLARLKRRTGMQIHGLLVGKRESIPLSKLCTHTHDFLIKYDTLASLVTPQRRVSTSESMSTSSYSPLSSSALSMTATTFMPSTARSFGYGFSYHERKSPGPGPFRNTRMSGMGGVMRAQYSDDEEMSRKLNRRKNKKRLDQDDNDFDWDGAQNSATYGGVYDQEDSYEDASLDVTVAAGTFNSRVEDTMEQLRVAVAKDIEHNAWTPNVLDNEKNEKESCWCYRGELHEAVDRIMDGLVEREEESRLVVLGLIAREHVLFLGVPGTGKSVLGRRLSEVCGGLFFQRLLTRFTTPEEIFGPLSLRALENDEYRRCTEGFLPTASVAFLDEIFKANSAILNTLLTILNERQFDNGAGLREECPVRCVVGASNELPESDELDALYDRFLLRKEVLPVSDEGIMKILGMEKPGVSSCDETDCDIVFSDGLDKVVDTLSKAADTVIMGDEVCALMRDMRTYLREELDIDISDRRLVKAARLLKVSAASHGRTRVDMVDCLLLQHVMWRLPEQRGGVREWLWDNITPGGAKQIRQLLNGIRSEALLVIRKTSGHVNQSTGARAADVTIIESLCSETSRLVALLQERSDTLARHSELLRRSMDHIWLHPDEARAAQQLLLPKCELVATEVHQLLSNARALEASLSGSSSPVSDDVRLSLIELLWDEDEKPVVSFTSEELSIGMKEAKAKYDLETFRAWKRARKKANK